MDQQKLDVGLPEGFLLVRAVDRRAAWQEAANDPSNELFSWTSTDVISLVGLAMWQEMHSDAELAPYQRLVVHEAADKIVVLGYCLPFFCPQLAAVLAAAGEQPPPQLERLVADWAEPALPDGGWGTMAFHAVRQALARQGKLAQAPRHAPWTEEQARELACGLASAADAPNALVGMCVAVKAGFKAIARQRRLAVIAVPAHLTMRCAYMDVSFAEYLAWSRGNPRRPEMSWLDAGHRRRSGESGTRMLPFDPWLRKHLELGAELVKVAPRNIDAALPVAQWLPFIRDKYRDADADAAAGGKVRDRSGNGDLRPWQVVGRDTASGRDRSSQSDSDGTRHTNSSSISTAMFGSFMGCNETVSKIHVPVLQCAEWLFPLPNPRL